jgi:lysophospholipase
METQTLPKSEHQGVRQPAGFPPLPRGWKTEWETLAAADGIKLFTAFHTQGKGGPRNLVILHGYGEHGGRYLHAPHYVADSVQGVYCPDHRGHGRSGGIRGHVEKFDDYARDAAQLIRHLDAEIKKRHGSSEIHLLGHSMGGTIAIRTLFLYPDLPIQSASISAPLLGVRVPVPPLKKMAGRVLAKIWGSVQLENGIDVTRLSHDVAVQEAYLQDRLVHTKVTPRFFEELEWAMADTLSRTSGITVPMQFLIPLADQVVDPDAAERFARGLEHKRKRIRTYAGCRHEPFNESCAEFRKETAFADVADWIQNNKAQ